MVSVKYVKNIKNREVGWTPHCQGIYSNKLQVLIDRQTHNRQRRLQYSKLPEGVSSKNFQGEQIALNHLKK
jgi:hypothetical protein